MTSENGKNHQEDIHARVAELERVIDMLTVWHNKDFKNGAIGSIERKQVVYISEVKTDDMSKLTEHGRHIKLANEIPLDELCRKVLYGSYLVGIDDKVLIERCADE